MHFLLRSSIFFLISVHLVFSFKFGYPKSRNSVNELKATNNNTAFLLPTNLKPSSYDLKLQPFLNNSTFKGWVTIVFDVLSDTNSIVLNLDSNYIKIISYTLTSKEYANITSTTIDTIHTQTLFNLNTTLRVQEGASLSISYDGVLAADMLGFYVSTYNTTIQHFMAITQFESNYARRAFPCFDEPAYRAQFSISILRLPSQNSMANMPLLTSSHDSTSDWVLDTYEPSPPMPTYLVAFGVSDLSNITNGTFRLFAREAAINDAAYLNSVGQTILDSIGNFTNIVYPLPKMDVVAIPDFNAGAMENWGLCTYREKYMLFNSSLNTWRDKYEVLSVNAHEFGHQWTGDLVTPAWWDYAWLNEAFATYFEHTIPNVVEPTWNLGSTEYIMQAVQEALDSDVGSPRAMTSPVYSTKQIEDSFDYVIYEKGGSVLRMTENFLSSDVWKTGLHIYLNNNSYKTGTPEELFSALQEAATAQNIGINDVNETLQGWTRQPGYPLITVMNSDNSITNATTTVYNITQVPYAFDDNTTSYTWNVPLRYTTEYDREFNSSRASLHWLYPSKPTSFNLTVNTSGWIIFNVDQVGYYRVNYDDDNWIKLKAVLDTNSSEISAVNRAQLVDDAMHLARTGHLSYSTALSLTEYLVNETAPEPWNAFFGNMKFLINQFYGTSTGNELMSWAQELMTTVWANLTSDLKSSVNTYQGSVALLLASQFACDIGLPECETFARTTFQMWRQNSSYITVQETKQAVICTGMRLDTSGDTFQDVWNYYLSSNNGVEQLMLINAMGCVTNQAVITQYLNSVCNSKANYVRLQDRWVAFRALMSRQTGVLYGLNYIANNFDSVKSALGSDFSNVYDYMAATISQEDHITVVKNLINNGTIDRDLQNSLNTTVLPAIEKRAAWAKSAQAQNLITWISAKTSKSSTGSLTVNLALTYVALIFVTCVWNSK